MNIKTYQFKVPVTELTNLAEQLIKVRDGICGDVVTYVIITIPSSDDDKNETIRLSLADLVAVGKIIKHSQCREPKPIPKLEISIFDDLISKIDINDIPGMIKL